MNTGSGMTVAISISAVRGEPKKNVEKAILLEDWGIEGPHLWMSAFVPLGSQATAEALCYFVLTKGVEKAGDYAVLRDLRQLP